MLRHPHSYLLLFALFTPITEINARLRFILGSLEHVFDIRLSRLAFVAPYRALISVIGITICSVGCVSASDDAQLNAIDSVPASQQPGLSAAEREDYDKEGFEFDEGLLDDEEEDAGEGAARTPGQAELDLPAELERADIDRFLRDRRTLTAPFEPVDAKYRSFLTSFEPDIRLSPDVTRELKLKIWDKLAQHHWVFVEGLYQFQTDLAEVSRAELRERKKRVIVHHLKALTFLGQALDERMGDSRYLKIVRHVYKMMADRHLMRPVKERKK